MKRTTTTNVQLGLFVMIGLTFLIAALYLIGSNQNLFDKTFEVNATFYNVNGLTKGNNVRFSGINVGTIKRVQIISDTSVKVTMIIENKVKPFIKKNSVAAVGTDGLMGNKLVNISNPTSSLGEIIQEGDMLISIKPLETDQMMRTLDQTNDNLYTITTNLKKITQKIDNNNSLWSILSDSTLAQNVNQSIANIRLTSQHAVSFTRDLSFLLHDLKTGNGIASTLLYDTISSEKLKSSLLQLQEASDRAAKITSDIKLLTEKMKQGEGGAGILLSDTAFANDLNRSMHNIQLSTERFDENMEALKHNFLFRGYFKKQEKELRKLEKTNTEDQKNNLK